MEHGWYELILQPGANQPIPDFIRPTYVGWLPRFRERTQASHNTLGIPCAICRYATRACSYLLCWEQLYLLLEKQQYSSSSARLLRWSMPSIMRPGICQQYIQINRWQMPPVRKPLRHGKCLRVTGLKHGAGMK
jgi:hypothetical protein